MRNFSIYFIVALLSLQMASAEEPAPKKTFAETYAEEIEKQLAEEEAELQARIAARPTEEQIAADCDAKGDLAVRILMMNKDGVPKDDAKATLRAEPESLGKIEPEGADMLVELMYGLMSNYSPESVKEQMVKNCMVQ